MSSELDPRPKKPLASRPEMIRWLLAVGAVVGISLLYPYQQNNSFPFEYELNQNWRYDDLTAPFEFPILKTEERFQRDQEEALENLSPVYALRAQDVDAAVDRFEEKFDQAVTQIQSDNSYPEVARQSDQLRAYGQETLRKLYQRGIVDLRPSDEQAGVDFVITIARGNVLRELAIANVSSPRNARSWLMDSLLYTNLEAPDFLLPYLEEQIQPNVFYSDSLTQQMRSRTLEAVSPYDGLLESGQTIVRRNGLISADVLQKLRSYQEQYELEYGNQRGFNWGLVGYVLLTSIVVLLLFVYLRHFFPTVYARIPKLIFVLMWPVLYALLIRTTELNTGINTYVIPFCIAPIVIRIFFNERLAFFTHVVVVLIASFLTSLGYEFTCLHLLAGIVVIVMDIDTRDWSRYFRSLIYLLGVYIGGYLSLNLIREGSLNNLDLSTLTALGVNVFLILLAYPLIPLLERLFGLLSPITLVELSDMNRPLLRELSLKAPGTLQHSLTVANMSEQAAQRIGADALLVHTAALYHDIGKTIRPTYFIENQQDGNPHNSLPPLESARIIVSHVSEGVKLAKKAGLPSRLIDFIRTHHGTTRTEYFYRSYLEQEAEGAVNEHLFRYPGPRPISKEESILMLADSVEAACKSLQQPTEEELTDFINKIIDGKVKSNQLQQSKLSFQELEHCRATFIAVMKSVHRPRIAYPEEGK
ncbi:MAG: HDIG domain-containing metalloprotein [Bacteroidota bacterium]